MNNKKYISLLLGLVSLFLSVDIFAFGIGVAVTGNNSLASIPVSSQTIVFPFKIDKKLVIEPYVGYKKFNDKEVNGSIFNVKTIAYGIGVMTPLVQKNSIDGYIGIKISKVDSEFKVNTSVDKFDIIELTPLVGFKYAPSENMSFGFEVGLTFFDGDYTDGTNTTLNSKLDGQETYSALVMHYYFD